MSWARHDPPPTARISRVGSTTCRTVVVALLATLAAATPACRDDAAPPRAADAPKPEVPAEPPRVTASLTGVVRLRVVHVSWSCPGVPFTCGKHDHEIAPIVEKLEVNADGTLPWAFVHLVSGPSTAIRDIAPRPVVVVQEGCFFAPHVFGVVAGQEVRFQPLVGMHSCAYIKGKRNPVWTMGFDSATSDPVYRPVKEFGVRIGTDCRSWMNAFMHVLDHPFFAVSERGTGRYEISGLAPGPHTFRAWHEIWTKEKQVEFTVDLQPGENVRDVEIGE